MNTIPARLFEKLKYYVYLYVDPRDGRPFYLGKGKGNRLLAHLDDVAETAKVQRIDELRKLGLEPSIEILKYGLSEHEALLVESAAIDLLGLEQLTNCIKGHHAGENGRGRLEDILCELDSAEVDICHPAILINIAHLYRYGMSPMELYDATRGIWRVGPRRANAELAFSVFANIIRAVYTIASWVPAGSTMTTRDYAEKTYELSERFEFVGTLAPETLQRKYVGKSVRKYFSQGAQNPIKYVNC